MDESGMIINSPAADLSDHTCPFRAEVYIAVGQKTKVTAVQPECTGETKHLMHDDVCTQNTLWYPLWYAGSSHEGTKSVCVTEIFKNVVYQVNSQVSLYPSACLPPIIYIPSHV